jgi:LemA protein
MSLKTGCLAIGGLGFLTTVGVILIAGATALGLYNGLHSKNQATDAAWAKVQSQYQRRLDLIPNLEAVVKAAVGHEHSTLTEIAAARSSVGRATVDIKNATPEQLAAFQSAHSGLSNALSKLMVVQENYPTLKASEQFNTMTAELAGTENRIAVARNDFNLTVQDFNASIVQFPAKFFAEMLGFKAKPYFQATEKAAEAPVVKF